MEARAQSGSGSQPLLQAPRDSGRQLGEPDPRDALPQQVHVLSLDQIRAIRNTNEYTEGPTVLPRAGLKPAYTMPLWGRDCPLLALAALACLSPAPEWTRR